MKAKEKAWQLYSNYFDIIEANEQSGELVHTHLRAINAALYCVMEAMSNAPTDVMQDFDGTGEYYSVLAYYQHVKNEIMKLNGTKEAAINRRTESRTHTPVDDVRES